MGKFGLQGIGIKIRNYPLLVENRQSTILLIQPFYLPDLLIIILLRPQKLFLCFSLKK